MSEKTDGEQIRDMIATSTGGASPLAWFPVGKTLRDWMKDAGGYVCHEDILLETGKGVFVCGLIGTMWIGVRAPDGSVLRAPGIGGSLDIDDVVLNAADPPGWDRSGCFREPSGRVVCKCPEDM